MSITIGDHLVALSSTLAQEGFHQCQVAQMTNPNANNVHLIESITGN